MPKRIVELETCFAIFPEDFDANQWTYNQWLERQAFKASRAGADIPLLPEKPRRKVISENQQKVTEKS